MKNIAERHKIILDKLDRKGFVSVQELSEELKVSLPTVRNDLRVLENQNLLVRSHGSASKIVPSVLDISINVKAAKNIDKKNKIAQAAQQLIKPDDAIILASGSTVTAFAKILQSNNFINVVTPSLGIALLLNEKENIEVMVLGGKMYKNSVSVRGEYAAYGLKNINCNKLFIGCDGINKETGITCATIEEAKLTNEMMSAAQKTIILADSSKFGCRGFGKICKMEDIDIIITDDGISQEMKEDLEQTGVQIIIA